MSDGAPALGRAMTPEERRHIASALIDMSGFDYSSDRVFDSAYFRRRYPGFNDYVYEILELHEKGVRYKEYRALLRKTKKAETAPALVNIAKTKVPPFSDFDCKAARSTL